MEYFNKEKINVLLITDPVDEFWMPMKNKFKDYEFASITKGEIKHLSLRDWRLAEGYVVSTFVLLDRKSSN